MAVSVSALLRDDADPTPPRVPRSRGSAAGGTPAASLEREPYNWTEDREQRVEFYNCRCSCRTCPKCGPIKGNKVRDRLLEESRQFTHPLMLTLTVDRSRHYDPLAAHERITEDGFIRRLMQRLGVKVWVWVLEFQGKTGLGWPHWHVLLDASHLPSRKIDLQLAWHLWRDEWGIGSIDVRAGDKFKGPKHAVFYITKYLTKHPKEGYPLWVLELPKRVRFFQASQSIGPLVASRSEFIDDPPELDSSETPGRDAEASKPTTRRVMRPLIDRMSACDTAANAILITPDEISGSATREWLGTIDANKGRLALLAREGKVSSDVTIVKTTVHYPGSTITDTRPVLYASKNTPPREVFKALCEELDTSGESHHRGQLIDRQRSQLLRSNVFAQRASELESQPQEPDHEAPAPF